MTGVSVLKLRQVQPGSPTLVSGDKNSWFFRFVDDSQASTSASRLEVFQSKNSTYQKKKNSRYSDPKEEDGMATTSLQTTLQPRHPRVSRSWQNMRPGPRSKVDRSDDRPTRWLASCGDEGFCSSKSVKLGFCGRRKTERGCRAVASNTWLVIAKLFRAKTRTLLTLFTASHCWVTLTPP